MTKDQINGPSVKLTTMIGVVIAIISLTLGSGVTAGIFLSDVSDNERRIAQVEHITSELQADMHTIKLGVERIKTDLSWLRKHLSDAPDE